MKDVKSNILVVVDFQYDFYDPDEGRLYVKGAEKCHMPIAMEIASKKYDRVIFTLDWHKSGDKSFVDNGGQWPRHCVQHTKGSIIHPVLLQACDEAGIKPEFFYKGTTEDHEEYGAFERKLDRLTDFSDGYWLASYSSHQTYLTHEPNEVNFTVCGLALDYCCWETFKNLKKHGFNVDAFYKGMASIGEPFDFEERWEKENK